MVAAVVIAVVEWPLTITFSANPVQLSLHELLQLSLGSVLLLIQGANKGLMQPIEQALHQLLVIIDMMGSHDVG